MNISSPGVAPVPPNFSTNTTQRKPPSKELSHCLASYTVPEYLNYDLRSREHLEENLHCECTSQAIDIFVNEQLVDCSLSFSVDEDIQIVGVILPTQLRTHMYTDRVRLMSTTAAPPVVSVLSAKYPELIYAFLQDSNGSRLTYTHFSARVSWDNYMEVSFNRPISIIPHSIYKIVVVLSKMGRYPVYTLRDSVRVNSVQFSLGKGENKESIFKKIIFRRTGLPSSSALESDHDMQ